MKAIVVGLGSMGRRRIRLLQTLDKAIPVIGIDTQSERRIQAEDELGIETREQIDVACREFSPDIAFVSTSPLSHATIIENCLKNNLHVFTELNLVDTNYDENIRFAVAREKILFLSSTFLYRKEIQFIKEKVDICNSPLSYMYHAGQYLPDWHPWESYKNFFVGDKRTNGCREFMAIEFPWLIDVFGSVKNFQIISSKNSSLDINFPDTYQIMFEHETGHRGLITIDIVSRKAVRKFELSGENLYLTWNGTPDSLYTFDLDSKEDNQVLLYNIVDHREGYSAFIIEDAYKSEIENFLNVVQGLEEPLYSFEKDKEILKLIDDIERS